MTHLIQIAVDPIQLCQLNSGKTVHDTMVWQYLDTTNPNTVWHSKEDYEYIYKNIKHQFNFSQSFIKQARKEGKSGYKYYLFDTSKLPKGKGGYGIVYPINAVFIRTEEGQIILKSQKHKLVKIQDHSVKEQVNSVIKEYYNLKQAGHLGVKEPIFFKNTLVNKSYLIMDEAEGFTLEQILNPDKYKEIKNLIPRLSVYKRLELTLAVLNAIKTQVTDRDLIHRDIKPGNIIVDLNHNPPIVKLIDYGFAINKYEQDYRRLGTRAYRSPESFQNRPIYTEKSDIYSAGRLLSYLWGDDANNYYISRTKDFDYIKTKSTNERLFSHPEIDFFLDDLDKLKIRKYLDSMLLENEQKRPTIEQTIELFSNINMQQYKEQETPNYSQYYLEEFKNKLNPQIMFIKQKLALMRIQEKDLRNRQCIDAANSMQKIIKKVEENTEYLQENTNPSVMLRYRKSCLTAINEGQGILKNHRNANWIVAEIVTAIALLGVGYLIALGVNYCCTGRLGLFTQTKSDMLSESLKDSVLLELNVL